MLSSMRPETPKFSGLYQFKVKREDRKPVLYDEFKELVNSDSFKLAIKDYMREQLGFTYRTFADARNKTVAVSADDKKGKHAFWPVEAYSLMRLRTTLAEHLAMLKNFQSPQLEEAVKGVKEKLTDLKRSIDVPDYTPKRYTYDEYGADLIASQKDVEQLTVTFDHSLFKGYQIKSIGPANEQ